MQPFSKIFFAFMIFKTRRHIQRIKKLYLSGYSDESIGRSKMYDVMPLLLLLLLFKK